MDDQKEILKLAAEIALQNQQELEDGYRNKLLIMDSQIEAHRKLNEDFVKRLELFDELLKQFEAMHQINLRFINLHREEPIGVSEEEWREKSLSHLSSLKKSVKSSN